MANPELASQSFTENPAGDNLQAPYGVEALRDVSPEKELAMLACLTVLDTAVGSGDGNKTSTVDDEFRMAQGDFGLEATKEDLYDLAA